MTPLQLLHDLRCRVELRPITLTLPDSTEASAVLASTVGLTGGDCYATGRTTDGAIAALCTVAQRLHAERARTDVALARAALSDAERVLRAVKPPRAEPQTPTAPAPAAASGQPQTRPATVAPGTRPAAHSTSQGRPQRQQ